MNVLPGMLIALSLMGLGACATGPARPVPAVEGPSSQGSSDCGSLADAERLRLVLIEDELQAGHPRAALAYLDALPGTLRNAPKAVYLRAEAYRAVAEYTQARTLYEALSIGCLAGAGYHGLGLIAAAQQDLEASLSNLYKARTLLSADPKVRNDYGYALLLAGRVAEARVEFETVLELSDRQPRAAGNLVLAMLVDGDESAALRYAQVISLSDERMQQLRHHADVLRERYSKPRDEGASL
jgi:Flp pilus assembly protein TadD